MFRERLIVLLFLSNFVSFAVADEDIWLLIDTKQLNLQVKQGMNTLAVLDNIAIGRNGAGNKERLGDDITPLGTYRIGWVNHNSRYYKFYGFDYPSIENAVTAFENGTLDIVTYTTIVNAHKRRKVPPQNTPIGGRIGIHGLGAADEKIHSMLNWTHGCIALTNQQIDKLDQWLNKGVLVKIK